MKSETLIMSTPLIKIILDIDKGTIIIYFLRTKYHINAHDKTRIILDDVLLKYSQF